MEADPKPFGGAEVVGGCEQRRGVEPRAEQAVAQVKAVGQHEHEVAVEQRDAGRVAHSQLEFVSGVGHRLAHPPFARLPLPFPPCVCGVRDGQLFEVCPCCGVGHLAGILLLWLLT